MAGWPPVRFKRFWSRRKVIAALRRYARHLGRTPTARDIWCPAVEGRIGPSAPTIRRIFGSLVNAQRAAGLALHRRGARLRSHCKRGHALEGENVETQRRKDGSVMRFCRRCRYLRRREQLDREKQSGRAQVLNRQRAQARAIARHNAELARYWGMAS